MELVGPILGGRGVYAYSEILQALNDVSGGWLGESPFVEVDDCYQVRNYSFSSTDVCTSLWGDFSSHVKSV